MFVHFCGGKKHKMDCYFKSSMCDERTEGEKRIMLCPPRSRGSSCSCAYLDQWEREDKTFSWIRLLPSGICKVTLSLRRAKVIQQLNKSFFLIQIFVVIYVAFVCYKKWKCHWVLGERKKERERKISSCDYVRIMIIYVHWKALVSVTSSRCNGTHL